ncbi:hypothetical protein ACQV88_22220 [Ralstonia pseudosolanacearum]|uniref:hypothetical protein n=1 Tax=Ralstonia pseudosolanacearum TaxID=1310165 RepID=UPI003D29A1ED
MTVPVPVPPLMRTGRPDPAGPRDSRRCAVAAATVVLVGAAPLAAHAARPSAGSQDDAASAATRRLIDAELAELNDGTAAPAAAIAPSDAGGLPASPARCLRRPGWPVVQYATV